MPDPTYDKLYKLIQQQLMKGRSPLDFAEDTWPKAKEILDAIYPEIARREHHYKVTLARLMNKLRAMAEDAEAQILD